MEHIDNLNKDSLLMQSENYNTDQEAYTNEIALRDFETYKNRPYFLKRQDEYPPIEEYIDGFVKGDQSQIDSYIQKCLEVKAKYPKPE